MLKFLTDFLKKNISKNNYNSLKQIYRNLKTLKYYNYNVSKDLAYNEKILKDLGINLINLKSELKKYKIDYNDSTISWHYHLFLAIKEIFKKKKIKNILEIGTFLGEFTNFLSKIYPNAIISTIDLKHNDKEFIQTYRRDNKKILKKFLAVRKKNLNKKNINFIELNSKLIKKYFKNKKFDLIFVDGDHLDPQVSEDIKNSLDLLKKNGIVCVDDIIIKKNYKDSGVSDEAYKTLNFFKKNQSIKKNYYIIKRISKYNKKLKKYISLSFKN